MDQQKIIQQTADFVKSKLYGQGTGHDWWHASRVWKTALEIGKKEGADLFVVQLAALLEDISDWKFNGGDTKASSKIAREFLTSIDVESSIIDHVCEIIETLTFKGAGVETAMRTLEGKIVQDADRLDAVGAIAIARTFAYGGYKQQEIYNPQIKPVLHQSFEQYKQSSKTSLNHFYEKLLLLKDRMNTNTGKKLAQERHEFMEKYLEQFFKEIGEDKLVFESKVRENENS
ncbi:TPA: phosphohydrolase [Candidatus Dependentiae bacterium]|nr:MAG: Metal dependent phosphohydrolase [candidate division TM6 bacterium GW2011_GWE2_31_21]KKP54005.1 MAG: Metal dependent phosphohydrolase [candidate division TM6 bacterium GW2011_GWF2_33_332]HBS48414.1 phosphohydrolase [Candidatus Dependentiae bacterium]HBZ72912.1 phosphohydrolase [Candidatus Dependentiae bacterium]